MMMMSHFRDMREEEAVDIFAERAMMVEEEAFNI